jgi:hypothetical protein
LDGRAFEISNSHQPHLAGVLTILWSLNKTTVDNTGQILDRNSRLCDFGGKVHLAAEAKAHDTWLRVAIEELHCAASDFGDEVPKFLAWR